MNADGLSILLLAAGLSRRFGSRDKLLADLGGVPLAARSARALRAFADAWSVERGVDVARIAVVGAMHGRLAALLAEERFVLVENPAPEDGQGSSLALGARAIGRNGMARDRPLLVALADMPFVSARHLDALAEAHDGRDPLAVTISRSDTRRLPPTLFGAGHLDALGRLTGDDGGRAIVARASRLVELAAPEGELRDIDVPGDIDRPFSSRGDG